MKFSLEYLCLTVFVTFILLLILVMNVQQDTQIFLKIQDWVHFLDKGKTVFIITDQTL